PGQHLDAVRRREGGGRRSRETTGGRERAALGSRSTMLRRTWLPALLAFSLASPDRRRLPADDTLLLRMPTVSAGAIAFVYAGDLWIVPRTGGEARQLTSAPGLETNPRFSPDGRWVAFSGDSSGNACVHVAPAAASSPGSGCSTCARARSRRCRTIRREKTGRCGSATWCTSCPIATAR